MNTMHVIFATASSGALTDAAKAHTSLKGTQSTVQASLFLIEESLAESQWKRFEKAAKEADLFIYDPPRCKRRSHPGDG
ncbi:hypothetical protein F3157_01630 [Virgibacillus dakarensis]|nr:hypothetical protein [Virgibacillus dakarensis]